MNIQDAEDLKDVTEDAFVFLLESQRELVEKYKDIEGMPDLPLDINTKEAQIWVKDFLWRVTEELAEAYEAKTENNMEHYLEELSDALHFYLEIYILIDYNPKLDDALLNSMIKDAEDRNTLQDSGADILMISMFNVVYHLGLTGNFLRNKKWKQTQVFVDIPRFQEELDLGFNDLVWLIVRSGIQSKYDFLNLYYKKFQVNQFRQRSKY
jgi:hypothetical protein